MGRWIKIELRKLHDMIMSLRRKSVHFAALSSVGGVSGAEYSTTQLQKLWDTMRLGHKFGRKKSDVRAFVFSSDLSPPSIAKHGASASDAFYPFPDGIEAAAGAGVSVVIQPGGSVGDEAVIARANELGLAMIFTGERQFLH